MAVDNFPKGTYEARVVEHPGRRTFTGIDPQTGEPTGETKIYDVTINEGTVTQQGTAWTPSVMNDLENRIGNSVGQIKNEFTATQYKNDSSLTTDAQTVVGGINEANAKAMNIANVFSTSSTYAVGAYCLYQNVLYKCTVAVTTAGAWDENKWTQVKVASELGSGGGATTFAGLTDTNFTNLQNGQIAKYNSSTQKWVNADETGGSAEFIKTATGAVASFSDAQAGYPLVNIEASIVPKQASGTPTPTNPLPISGWTEGTFTKCNKNFLNNTGSTETINGVTFTVNDDKSVTVNGTASDRASFVLWFDYSYLKNYFKTTGIYYLSGCPQNGSASTYSLCLQASGSGNVTDIGSGIQLNMENLQSQPYRFIIDIKKNTVVNNITFYPMLALTSGETYEPYNGTTATAQFGETVYGGTWKASEGKVEPTYAIVDLADLSWTYQQDYSRWITTGIKTTIKIDSTTDTSKVIPAYCEKYKPTSYANLSTNEITYYNSNGNVFCNNGSSSETPTGKLAYLLDTPSAEISVDAVNLTAQDGVNNIFADTGDTSVTYATEAVGDIAEVLINDGRTASNTTWSSTKVNTQLSSKQNALTAGTGIDITSDTISVTGRLKDASIANDYDSTATYSVGDYCIYDGLLYVCTTAISTAEDWDATHWTQTNVMSQMPATPWKDVTGTLSAGSTSITIQDASITTSSTIDIYTDPPEIPHNSMTVTTGNVALTFDAQQSATIVKVRIS